MFLEWLWHPSAICRRNKQNAYMHAAQNFRKTWKIQSFLKGNSYKKSWKSPRQSDLNSSKLRFLIIEVSIFGEENFDKEKLELNQITKVEFLFLNVYNQNTTASILPKNASSKKHRNLMVSIDWLQTSWHTFIAQNSSEKKLLESSRCFQVEKEQSKSRGSSWNSQRHRLRSLKH